MFPIQTSRQPPGQTAGPGRCLHETGAIYKRKCVCRYYIFCFRYYCCNKVLPRQGVRIKGITSRKKYIDHIGQRRQGIIRFLPVYIVCASHRLNIVPVIFILWYSPVVTDRGLRVCLLKNFHYLDVSFYRGGELCSGIRPGFYIQRYRRIGI